MSVQMKGEVRKLFEGRFGNKGSFTVQGSELFFNTKDVLPAGVWPGATVEFTYQVGRNGKSAQVDPGTLHVVASQAPAPAASGGAWSSPTREGSIHYQSARKDAIAFVDMALRVGAIPLPEAAAKKLTALESILDQYTALFYEDISALGALERATPAEIPAAAPEAKAPAGGKDPFA